MNTTLRSRASLSLARCDTFVCNFAVFADMRRISRYKYHRMMRNAPVGRTRLKWLRKLGWRAHKAAFVAVRHSSGTERVFSHASDRRRAGRCCPPFEVELDVSHHSRSSSSRGTGLRGLSSPPSAFRLDHCNSRCPSRETTVSMRSRRESIYGTRACTGFHRDHTR